MVPENSPVLNAGLRYVWSQSTLFHEIIHSGGGGPMEICKNLIKETKSRTFPTGSILSHLDSK